MSARLYRVLFWLGVIAAAVLLLLLLQGILMPFAASFIIAYLLKPAVDRLQAWRLPRGFASLVVLLAFLVAVGLVLLLIVPLVHGQIVRLIDRLPGLVATAQQQLGHLVRLLQQHLPEAEAAKVREVVSTKIGDIVTWAASVLQSMITSSFAILNIISLIVVTPVVAFFLLRDWHVMADQIESYLPREPLATIRVQLRIVNETLAGFIHGQGLVCVILAVYYTITLSLAGLDSALAIGILIGVLAVIPVAGAAIGFILSVGLAALQFDSWTPVLVVVAIFVVGQTVEANILTPKLVGDRIHLHPVWVIFALLAGGKLFGFLGVLLSVPAAAVVGVVVRLALERYRASTLYDPHQAEQSRRIVPFE